jgi:hypothetical protein
MGRQAIRDAVTAQFTDLAVPFVGTVFPARPVIMDEADYTQTMMGKAVEMSDHGSSCVLVVNIPKDSRSRTTLTGRAHVDDFNIHKMAVELFFGCTSGDALAAQSDYDSIVDALVVAIRNNPTPGGANTVWSAGEFKVGVNHEQGAAYTNDDGLTIMINGLIKYDAWEAIAGTDV